ncbi:hypothetical protein C0J52_09481 [Blattella germanica]|nr:hypothetical protein C0J52_09481 [Blattella germanica]
MVRMDVELLRPGTARPSQNSVLWFEFLLDPGALENHLQQSAPVSKDSETKPSENESPENLKNDANGGKRSYKFLALKILALKVSAFLKWDLNILESKLPLPMQLTLLQDLLYMTLEKDSDVESHMDLDLDSCPRQVVFAVTLYHRWVIRAVMNSRLATKQARQPYIPVPGLQDPTYVPPNVSEDLGRGLESQVANSIAVLSRIVAANVVPIIPVFETFLHFDLGSFHFFREEYPTASEHFTKAIEYHEELGDKCSVYCKVSSEDLKGYSEACDLSSPTASTQNLTYQFHRAIRDQYTGIVSILQMDNLRQEIPQVYRDTLELDIQGAMSSRKFTVARDLLLQVQTLNVVRRVTNGILTCGDYMHKLRNGKPKAIDSLFNALKHVLPQAGSTEKERIKMFLLQILECGDVDGFAEKLLKCEYLMELFSAQELQEISSKTAAVAQDDAMHIPELLLKTDWDMPDFKNCKNSRLELGNLEQKLMLSYDATEIRVLVEKLWELPIPLQGMAMMLPRGFVQDYAYILLAKSRELTTMKDFKMATGMLAAVEQEARSSNVGSNVLYKFCKLLAWETLLIQMIQFLTDWPDHKLNTNKLVVDCKQCLSTIQTGDNVIPRLEVMEHCAVCLLNLGEWEYLTSLEKRWNYFEIAAAIAYACLDIAKYKGNKKVSRDAWDIVLPIFGPNAQQKRTSSGTTTLIHRDSPTSSSTHTRSTLTNFLSRLRDGTALAVVISLLARLHNVLRDEPSLELSVDYAGLWPAVLLLQALQYHPTNVAWLKVMGDLNFVLGHHAMSLRYYLEAAIVVSDFFSQQPIPRAAIDDHVYRRMIKCCTQLQCHTQAAVLCQFLEDVDYSTAFKSLGDIKSTCSDAMDSYYSCIWDTTILEYLVHLHTKRGEHHRKQLAIKVIGLLELNANNNEEIQREAANIRKARFLRSMARQYMSSKFDLIKTIEDDENVSDYSEDSDEEEEFQPTKQKKKKNVDFDTGFKFVSSVAEYNADTWDDLSKYIKRKGKTKVDDKIENARKKIKKEEKEIQNMDDGSQQPEVLVSDSGDSDSEISLSEDELKKDDIKEKSKAAIAAMNFIHPTPIQAATIPVALLGRDICGCAATGTGKTAAYMLPILERLLYRPMGQSAVTRVLVLVPTRELGVQVYQVTRQLAQFTSVESGLAVGGLDLKAQEAVLRKNPDIVIATPGRLIDHLKNTPTFSLDNIEVLVLDEADRMLDEYFAEQMKEIVQSCARTRQTMLFSATMTEEVEDLVAVSLNKPVKVFVDSNRVVAFNLRQEFVRIRADREGDREAILAALICRTFRDHTMVFVQTKKQAHRLHILMGLLGVKVINFVMPPTVEHYIHRVGRTARAGRVGVSVSLAGEAERKVVKEVVKKAKNPVKMRIIATDIIEKYRTRVTALEEKVKEILQEEWEERELSKAENQANRAENMLKGQEEMPRSWFQSQKERKEETKKLKLSQSNSKDKKSKDGHTEEGKQAKRGKRGGRNKQTPEDRIKSEISKVAAVQARLAKKKERPRSLKRKKSSFAHDLTDVSQKGAKRMRYDANFKQKMDKKNSKKGGAGKVFGQKKSGKMFGQKRKGNKNR